jgi:hypothetical protein
VQFTSHATNVKSKSKYKKPHIMKKAILTFGLLSLVMVLTSFTAPQTTKVTINNNASVEAAGSQSVGGNVKLDAAGSQSVGGNVKLDAAGSQSVGGNVKLDAAGSQSVGGNVKLD